MRLIDAEPLEAILWSRAMKCLHDYGSISGAISGCMKLLRAQPTIAKSDMPLTLDELRDMDGEPVYIFRKGYGGFWYIVKWHGYGKSWIYHSDSVITSDEYGENWLAYRCRPEDGEVDA